ncbi:MAG: hypothetical protein JSV17_12890 [Candidatus Aminicenantes bacterium]|nr:MAG: hypothetical protein JSV17_12890 [Candidatus Aminicenantes bacterium]
MEINRNFEDLHKEGLMKFRNLSRLFILVFILGFAILCQSDNTNTNQMRWEIGDIGNWVIPDSIKAAYPEDPEKKDWQDLQRDLLFAINKLDSDIEHYRNKPFQIAKVLAKQRVWLKKADGNVVSGIGPLRNYLATELAGQRISIKSIPQIEWFHFPGEDVDIYATVTFDYEIQTSKPGGNPQTLDPPGSGDYGHRKICTWY